MIFLIHLFAWQASFFIFSSKALLRMGRLELLFTSFTNSLQPRRNVQSSHVKGFNKARGMLLVLGVGRRDAKSYKAQLPCGAHMLLASEPFVCTCLLRTSCFLFNFRYHSCSQRRLSRAFSLADLFFSRLNS